MTIYSEFSHEKLWFSIVMLVYQRVHENIPLNPTWAHLGFKWDPFHSTPHRLFVREEIHGLHLAFSNLKSHPLEWQSSIVHTCFARSQLVCTSLRPSCNCRILWFRGILKRGRWSKKSSRIGHVNSETSGLGFSLPNVQKPPSKWSHVERSMRCVSFTPLRTHDAQRTQGHLWTHLSLILASSGSAATQ